MVRFLVDRPSKTKGSGGVRDFFRLSSLWNAQNMALKQTKKVDLQKLDS